MESKWRTGSDFGYLPQVVVEGEALSANLAGIRLLGARVDSVVLLEGVGRDEAFAAGSARKRPLSRVLAHVHVQQRAVVEAQTARCTLVRLRIRRFLVAQRKVTLQSGLRLAADTALGTRVRTRVPGQPVAPQVALRGERGVASSALEHRQIGVRAPYVVL